jgi:hypothetical protein
MNTLSLQDIPSVDVPPPDAVPSAVVSTIRAIRPSRRTMMRGLVLAAAATVLTPIEWFYSRREARASGPATEFLACEPATYDETPNNWWKDGLSVCTGGWRIGSFPCADGYHREGKFSARHERYVSNREPDTCGGRNAWRWAGYRCSDAWTVTRWSDGDEFEGPTIAMCKT